MTTVTVILLVTFAFGASFTQRVTGFGFGIFIMTILPYIMPSYGEATAASGLLALSNVLVTSIRMWKYIEWRKLLPILLTFLVVSFFAVGAVARINEKLLRHLLGGLLICVGIYFFIFSNRIRMKPSIPIQVGMGTISGLMGGLFAMQGPPAALFFMSCTERKENYTALISAYFLIGNGMMTLFRAGNGFVTPTVGMSVLIAIPAIIAGLWLGGKIYDKMPVRTLRKVVYGFMCVAGAIALFS